MLANDVLDGLTRPFKELPPKHFYDARGSELFERICDLPEYYPTRTEKQILERNVEEIVDRTRRRRAGRARLGRSRQGADHARRHAAGGNAEALRAARRLRDRRRGGGAPARRRARGTQGPRRGRRLRAAPRSCSARSGHAAHRGAARWDDRQLPTGHSARAAAQDRRAAGPRRSAAPRHGPGQGAGADRGRLRRRRGRDRGVQPQRPACDQSRARRRLRARCLRARRVLRPPPRVGRDAPAREAPLQCADRRPRPSRRVRRRRGSCARRSAPSSHGRGSRPTTEPPG